VAEIILPESDIIWKYYMKFDQEALMGKNPFVI
jgi:hypothetical protein